MTVGKDLISNRCCNRRFWRSRRMGSRVRLGKSLITGTKALPAASRNVGSWNNSVSSFWHHTHQSDPVKKSTIGRFASLASASVAAKSCRQNPAASFSAKSAEPEKSNQAISQLAGANLLLPPRLEVIGCGDKVAARETGAVEVTGIAIGSGGEVILSFVEQVAHPECEIEMGSISATTEGKVFLHA